MWFPDKPYPGHDVDEKNPVDDLQKGTRVLIRALVDIATGPRIASRSSRSQGRAARLRGRPGTTSTATEVDFACPGE